MSSAYGLTFSQCAEQSKFESITYMNHGMKESVDESVQKFRLRFSPRISGRVEIGLLREYVFFQDSGCTFPPENFSEECDVSAIVAAKLGGP